LAVFWFGVPGLQVLPEYVPPAAVHSELELFLMVPEHAASGSANRATIAVVINIFLGPIVVASCCKRTIVAVVMNAFLEVWQGRFSTPERHERMNPPPFVVLACS